MQTSDVMGDAYSWFTSFLKSQILTFRCNKWKIAPKLTSCNRERCTELRRGNSHIRYRGITQSLSITRSVSLKMNVCTNSKWVKSVCLVSQTCLTSPTCDKSSVAPILEGSYCALFTLHPPPSLLSTLMHPLLAESWSGFSRCQSGQDLQRKPKYMNARSANNLMRHEL